METSRCARRCGDAGLSRKQAQNEAQNKAQNEVQNEAMMSSETKTAETIPEHAGGPQGPAALSPIPPDAVDRYFELSLFFLLAVGFLTLAGTGKMDFFTISLMGLALAGRAFVLWRRSSFQLSPQLVSRLTVFYIPFYFVDFLFLLASRDTILERLLLATIHMIFFTAAVKMLSARSTRDYVYLAALAFAQMLAAATLTVQTSFLFYFALFLLLAIMTFTSLEIKRARARVAEGGTAPPPASLPGRLSAALSGTAGFICGGTVVLATLLFFVIPRGSRGFFSSLALPSDRITGFSDQVELGEIGQIKRLTTVVMHIQAPALSTAHAVKWRGIGLTTFDGKRWFNRNLLAARVPQFRRFRFRQDVFHPGQANELLPYTITLQPVASDALFLAPQPVELTGPFRDLWQDEAGSVYLRSGSSVLVRYSAVSDIASPHPDLLRTDSGRIPPEIEETYLQLPPVDPRARQLALDITRRQTSIYEKARAVEEHLQTSYGYTLDQPAARPADPIAYFLFEARQGHCEFFAAAMAVLLRTQGIPARLVNGFLQGSYNDLSGQFTVRASDAHTWVEVYFPTYGWVGFDPTPAEGRLAQALFLGRLTLYLDAFQTFWEEWVINYDIFHQVTLARQLETTSRQVTRDSRRYFRRQYRYLVGFVRQRTDFLRQNPGPALLLLALGLLGVVALTQRKELRQWFREQRMLRHARQGRASPEDATLAYLRLLRILARSGLRKTPAQTPSEFASAVPEPAGPLVRDFTQLYLRTRFGRLADDLPRLSALLQQIHTLRRSPRPSEPRA